MTKFYYILLLFILAFVKPSLAQEDTKKLSIYYASNVYQLSNQDKKEIQNLLNNNAFESIQLIGYADSVGNFKANLKISELRAKGIEDYILSEIKTASISSSANGESNSKGSLLQSQRRVDIIISLIKLEEIEEFIQDEIQIINPKVNKLVENNPSKVSPKKQFKSDLLKNDKLILDNIQFEAGKSNFLYNKIPNELFYLADIMDSLPSMRIKLEGHVCCVDNKKLSTSRAKEVYTFLRGMGIDKSRMEYVGYSNSKPLYEELTISDQQKNRRVEILILER